MKKRTLSLLLLVSLLGAVLTGCGGGSTEETPETRAAANAITVGIAQDLDSSLDPHKIREGGDPGIMFNVFEGLMKPTPEGDLIPAVAENYTISDDETVYTFTLRTASSSTTAIPWTPTTWCIPLIGALTRRRPISCRWRPSPSLILWRQPMKKPCSHHPERAQQ